MRERRRTEHSPSHIRSGRLRVGTGSLVRYDSHRSSPPQSRRCPARSGSGDLCQMVKWYPLYWAELV